MRYHWVRNSLAFVHWGVGIVLAGIGWFIGALACDEACSEGAGWSRSADAWQWEAVQLLALGLLAVLSFFFVAALVGRVGLASLFFAVQAASTLTILVLLAAAESVTIAPGILLLIAAAEVPGVLAVGNRKFSGL
jgi:hypothetical protein